MSVILVTGNVVMCESSKIHRMRQCLIHTSSVNKPTMYCSRQITCFINSRLGLNDKFLLLDLISNN
jgi:hypothetical protein